MKHLNLLEQKRKMGKEVTKKDQFKFDKFGRSISGAFFSTRIGLSNVYKKGPNDEVGGIRHGMGENTRNNAIEGYNLLKENKLPVTEFKGTVMIRGEPRLVFEKARDLTKKEIRERLPGMLEIADMAMKKRLCIDLRIDNLGINKRGKLVIRDPHYIFNETSLNMIDLLIDDLERRGFTDLRKTVRDKRNELYLKYMGENK
jgi:hypothetical protein